MTNPKIFEKNKILPNRPIWATAITIPANIPININGIVIHTNDMILLEWQSGCDGNGVSSTIYYNPILCLRRNVNH